MPACSGALGPGEMQSQSGLKGRDAGQIDLVVAEDQDLQVELVKELHQVIGKGVVVVDHHQAHRPPSSMKFPEGADRRVRPLRAHTQVRPYRTT